MLAGDVDSGCRVGHFEEDRNVWNCGELGLRVAEFEVDKEGQDDGDEEEEDVIELFDCLTYLQIEFAVIDGFTEGICGEFFEISGFL